MDVVISAPGFNLRNPGARMTGSIVSTVLRVSMPFASGRLHQALLNLGSAASTHARANTVVCPYDGGCRPFMVASWRFAPTRRRAKRVAADVTVGWVSLRAGIRG